MKIWKPLMCGSLLAMASVLPAQAHGPWTSDYSRSDRSGYTTSDMMDTGTSRDAHGMPAHGAFGTGSMSQEWAMRSEEGGYTSRPTVTQPSYAPRERRMSDEYQFRGY
jgi:hypothetical protein